MNEGLVRTHTHKEHMKTIQNIIYAAFAVIAFTSPAVRAVNPPPDGGYPNGNTAEGQAALLALSTGGYNTAIGWFSLLDNTTGEFNTAVGAATLVTNTANNNTAIGTAVLFLNTTGEENAGTGAFVLFNNTVGSQNTANGFEALYNNTEGDGNTATGADALYSNTEGGGNTATGLFALEANTNGNLNTATGDAALTHNSAGNQNTCAGFQALWGNTTGSFNTANGSKALGVNTTGTENTGAGYSALIDNTTGSFNTADGSNALSFNTTGSGNIAVGNQAGSNLTTGDNNIDVGNEGIADESNTIRIGTQGTQTAAFIAGINGATASGGTAVFVDTNGQLGTLTSSARFKDNIKPMDKASESILALKPVTFRYKKEIDPAGTSQFGLVAEEVEKVNPSLVVRDKDGKPYSVRYEQVNAMLLNEFLKEHRTVQEQQNEINVLQAELKEQRALIQRVNDKVELTKPVPQTVLNNQ